MEAGAQTPEVIASVEELAREALVALRRLERGLLLEQLDNQGSKSLSSLGVGVVTSVADLLARRFGEPAR